MKGRYNGSYIHLSSKALRRLAWFDFYQTHGKNISLTCRHFGISRDTFYLWKKRFNTYQLHTLEDDKKTRRPKQVRVMTTPYWIQQKDEGIQVGQTAIQSIPPN